MDPFGIITHGKIVSGISDPLEYFLYFYNIISCIGLLKIDL